MQQSSKQGEDDLTRRCSYQFDPKIWLGISWLRTYIALRPGALPNILEKHIDLEGDTLCIPHPKEKRPKLIPLLPEYIELVRQLPRGFPCMPFFRHPKRIGRANEGEPYGQNYFRKW